MTIRQRNWQQVADADYDVTILGGGINGAALFRQLARAGYRVLLLDRGDFACGTSSASAMMIWGGLLYLKNLDIPTVLKFSRDRDALIDGCADQIAAQQFAYLPNRQWGRSRHLVWMGLQLYWAMGRFRRSRPAARRIDDLRHFVRTEAVAEALLYQEGVLRHSDCRFLLEWILANQSDTALALNYCQTEQADYSARDRCWRLALRDRIGGGEKEVQSRMVVNCAGVWLDEVNKRFGIESPVKHLFSKGVFVGYSRPDGHEQPLIFEMGEHGDTLTLIPWGPISLWGPTETMTPSVADGFRIEAADLHFLRRHAARNLTGTLADSTIVSLRCGVRPLAVARSHAGMGYPLDISRRHLLVEDRARPWLSIYGGKISGCLSMANEAAQAVARRTSAHGGAQPAQNWNADLRHCRFPGIAGEQPSIDWCIEEEFCTSLEDYLRRRTNIAQWVVREGLGAADEHLPWLTAAAAQIAQHGGPGTAQQLDGYRDKVRQGFDTLLAGI